MTDMQMGKHFYDFIKNKTGVSSWQNCLQGKDEVSTRAACVCHYHNMPVKAEDHL